jgi:hypothetical protein
MRALGLVRCLSHDALKLQALPSLHLLTETYTSHLACLWAWMFDLCFCMVHRLCCQICNDLPWQFVNEYCTENIICVRSQSLCLSLSRSLSLSLYIYIHMYVCTCVSPVSTLDLCGCNTNWPRSQTSMDQITGPGTDGLD